MSQRSHVALLLLLAVFCVLIPRTGNASAGGRIIGWGDNTYGELDFPTGLSDVVAVAAGASHGLALREGGTVVAWGDPVNGETTIPTGLNNVIAIAASNGNHHCLALRSDGTVVAWGFDDHGQTDVPAGLTGVIAVSAGADHSLALKSDGTVVAWGDNTYGQSSVPPGLSGVIAIAAGGFHNLALRRDGNVIAWGRNSAPPNPNGGQAIVPPGLSGVTAVSAGYFHSLALKTDGTVVAWGDDTYGQTDVPASLTNAMGVFAGSGGTDGYSLALKSDNSLIGWGANKSGVLNPSVSLAGVSEISASNGFLGFCLAIVPADTIPPIFGSPMIGMNAGAKTVSIAVRDSGSGLARVSITKAINCNVTVAGNPVAMGGSYTFSAPPTTSQLIVASKINQSLSSTVAAVATDAAGNSSSIDPILVTLVIPKGGDTVTKSLYRIPDSEHYLTVINGAPGVRKVGVIVNARRDYRAVSDGQTVTEDLAAGMRPGGNAVLITASGRSGGSATVTIGDTALTASQWKHGHGMGNGDWDW